MQVYLKKKLNKKLPKWSKKKTVRNGSSYIQTVVYTVHSVETEIIPYRSQVEEPDKKTKLDAAWDEQDAAVYEAQQRQQHGNKQYVVTWFLVASPVTGEFMWIDATNFIAKRKMKKVKERKR
jgi:hypothetical protein